MKKFLFLLFLPFKLFATNYYVSNAGSDANNGLTTSTTWLSIAKINGFTFAANDSILFNRGDVFYGGIIVKRSNLKFGAYGAGAKPIITGFSTASSFTNIGGNIWESAALSNTNKPNAVTIGGVIKALGRYPNTAYNYYSAFDATTYITDAALSGMNFTGGRLCVRKLHDQISNDSIVSHTGGTVTYAQNLSGYNTLAGYGYFIENHLNTLDVQDEWFFNLSTKKIDIYSTTYPTNVRVSTIDTLFYIAQYDFITVDGISFEGANIAAIAFGGPTVGQSTNDTIKNCGINFCGRDAIYCTYNQYCVIDSNTITNSLSNGIIAENEGGRSLNITVTNNNIINTGMLPGMGYFNILTSNNTAYNAITILGDNSLIKNNFIDTVGHVGIAGYYSGQKVKQNFIRYHNQITDDGGGINFFDVSASYSTTGIEIDSNVVLEGGKTVGIGTADGGNTVVGIYLDDKISGVSIRGNNVSYSHRYGIYLHNTANVTIRGNTIYDAFGAGFLARHDNHAYGLRISNTIFANNLIFQLKPLFNPSLKQEFAELINYVDGGNVDSMFTRFDSNFYARPIYPIDTTFRYTKTNITSYKNLTSWKTAFASTPFGGAWDANSTEMASNTNASNFYYNASNAAAAINFTGLSKKDVYGNIYNNSVSIPPWGSRILLDNGSVALPPGTPFKTNFNFVQKTL